MVDRQPNNLNGINSAELQAVDDVLGMPEFEMSADERQGILLDMIREQTAVLEVAKNSLVALVQEARRQDISFARIGEATNRSAQATQQWLKRQNPKSQGGLHA